MKKDLTEKKDLRSSPKTVSYMGTYHLSDDELAEMKNWMTDEIISIVTDKEAMTDRQAIEKKDMKKREETLYHTAHDVKNRFRTGWFECEITYEDTTGMKHYIDTVSGKIVGSEPMTKQEIEEGKQTTLLKFIPKNLKE